jgi:hypothetical protein
MHLDNRDLAYTGILAAAEQRELAAEACLDRLGWMGKLFWGTRS